MVFWPSHGVLGGCCTAPYRSLPLPICACTSCSFSLSVPAPLVASASLLIAILHAGYPWAFSWKARQLIREGR